MSQNSMTMRENFQIKYLEISKKILEHIFEVFHKKTKCFNKNVPKKIHIKPEYSQANFP